MPAVKNGGPPQDYDDSQFPGGTNSGARPQTGEQAEEIEGKHMKTAEPLIAVFGEETIRRLFSKKWQNRAKALEEIEQFTIQNPDQCFSDALAALNVGLKDKIQGVTTKAMQTFENLLNMVSGVTMHSMLKTNLDFLGM